MFIKEDRIQKTIYISLENSPLDDEGINSILEVLKNPLQPELYLNLDACQLFSASDEKIQELCNWLQKTTINKISIFKLQNFNSLEIILKAIYNNENISDLSITADILKHSLKYDKPIESKPYIINLTIRSLCLGSGKSEEKEVMELLNSMHFLYPSLKNINMEDVNVDENDAFKLMKAVVKPLYTNPDLFVHEITNLFDEIGLVRLLHQFYQRTINFNHDLEVWNKAMDRLHDEPIFHKAKRSCPDPDLDYSDSPPFEAEASGVALTCNIF